MNSFWEYSISLITILVVGVVVSLFLAIPKAVKHYKIWEKSNDDKYLGRFFIDLYVGAFLLIAASIISIKKLYAFFN